MSTVITVPNPIVTGQTIQITITVPATGNPTADAEALKEAIAAAYKAFGTP